MRIILIHQAFNVPDQPGGSRHYELARYCVSEGHEFTIVASDLNYATGKHITRDGERVEKETLDGIRIVRARTYPAIHRSYAWRVIAFLGFMRTSFMAAWRVGPVDVVMGTSPPIFQGASTWLLAFLRRRPYLLEIRDLCVDGVIQQGILKNPILIAMTRCLERFLLKRATHLLVNSPAFADRLMERGIPPAKMTIIPNGVDPDTFDPEIKGEDVREELGLDGKFVVMYTGALGHANDIPTILRAADRLRDRADIQFVLVGDGKERSKLEAQAEEMDLPNVTFAGSRPKLEMKRYLGAADAGIAALQDIEIFRTVYPNKVFDYMAAGRPIVLGIEGAIREVVEAGECGICVAHGDDEAIAAAVVQLSENRELAAAMGRAGREHVVEHFNRHKHAVEFVELLERLRKK